MASENATWRVGQAARAAGATRKAIRVYEARGLLSPARTAAGYRLFTDADVDTLRFIRRARSLGLGLDDVAEVLAQSRGGATPCVAVRVRLAERVAEIDKAVAELQGLRASLIEAAERCPPESAEAVVCPIIEGVGELPG